MKCIGSGAVTLFAVLRFSASCQGDWNRSSLRMGNRILLALIYGKKLRHLTLRRLMSYIYGAPILDVSRSHTTTQHSR